MDDPCGDMFTEFGEFGADGGDDALVGVAARRPQRLRGENVVDGGEIAEGVFAHDGVRGRFQCGRPLR